MTREEVVGSIRPFLERAGVSPEAHLVAEAGDASTTIVDQALTTRADLIVIGTHGRRGFKRLLLGSVTETVLHEAPCPVLTVSPHTAAASSDVVTFKRILCPIDFSPSALQALGFALDLARQADGRVTLLHVFEWLPEDEPRSTAHFNVPEFRGYIVNDARQRLRSLVTEESRAWCEIDDLIVFGRAHREILREAEARSADLVVMGSQGRGGVGLALFGSTTHQVVRSAACPVLTVRGLARA
jgi:nucleotide-binding universal stress UspA family protein